MKFTKKYIVVNVTIWIILFVLTINNPTKAVDDINMILVTGKVENNKNEYIENVEVSFIDTSTNKVIGSTKTDSNGEYIINIPVGKYKVEFKYSQNYDTNKIDIQKYDLYDKNLELAVVYHNELEEKIKYLNSRFTDNAHDFRLIKNSYSDDKEIKEQIHNLQRDSQSENAFHNLIYEGFKGVTVILSNKAENEIQSYIDDYLTQDYNTIICGYQESITSILSKVYSKLEKNLKYMNKDTIESKNSNSCKTIEIELLSTSIINVITSDLNEEDTAKSGEIPSGSYGDFISGQIKVGDELHTGEVTINLVNVKTNKKKTIKTTTGKYFINYPYEGTYKLEFEFKNTNDFNGQYYEAEKISSNNNCMIETSREDINKYYKDISYEKEKELDDYTSYIEEKIKGESQEFYVSPISDSFDPGNNNNKIVKNVQLKERDKFSLTVEENVNKFKIILSNGQIFKEYDLKSNPNNENYNLRLFNITMETELSYGAKLLVEYEIKVKNNSNIDCTGYTLVNRFENLEFDKKQYLLSDTKTKNGDKEWEVIDNSDVKTLTGNSNYDNDVTELITYLKLENRDGLKAGKDKTHYITLTRSLDAENDDTMFNAKTELVKYKNDQGRRNYENTNLTGNVKDDIIRAGAYFCFSESIAILPPTGFDIKTMCSLIISAIVCLLGFKHLISNKLYINFKKSKLRRKWNK